LSQPRQTPPQTSRAVGEGDGDLRRQLDEALEAYARYVKNTLMKPGRSSIGGRVLLGGRAVQVEDVYADPEYDLELSRRMTAHLGQAMMQVTRSSGCRSRRRIRCLA
jgi:hypothetical protein